jgi:hypothetical protein
MVIPYFRHFAGACYVAASPSDFAEVARLALDGVGSGAGRPPGPLSADRRGPPRGKLTVPGVIGRP